VSGRRKFAAVTAAIFLLAASVGAAVVATRIVPGVRVAGVAVGGLTREEAHAALFPAQLAFGRAPVLVIDADTVWPTTNADLGVTLDVEAATSLAFSVGRRGAPSERVEQVARATAGAVDLGWPRLATDARLDAFIDRIANEIDRAPIDGAVAIDAGVPSVTAPAPGLRLDRALLRADVLGDRHEVSIVAVTADLVEPAVGEADIADAAARLIAADAPLRLVAGSESVTIDPARALSLLRVVGPAHGVAARLVIDGAALDALVADAAVALDGAALAAVLVPGEDVLGVVPGRDGVVVDQSAARAAIAEALFGTARSVDIRASVTHPSLSTSRANEIAAAVRLQGAFTTFFPVNEARRINISRAAATFDGIAIAPGETFSFWDRIGEVSPRTGYTYAGAIIGGVSSTAIGGGLCQVSTTLFNAVARAGLAIGERHPHAYYIERYPLGLDAAVFAPDTDLVWTNDTSEPLTIRATSTDTSVTFWIYSAPTGRVTTFSDPAEWNLRWPYAGQPADPAHAPGYVVLGRDVLVTRTVTEGGALVHEDSFLTHYAPVWGGPG